MRQITEQAASHFRDGSKFSKSNTKVEVRDNLVSMYLSDNLIARRRINSRLTEITLAGWNSQTTRERLNGLGANISCKNYAPYIKLGGATIEMNPKAFYTICL